MTNEENGRREGPMLRLVLGDCFEKMQTLPERAIEAIITDPPYG